MHYPHVIWRIPREWNEREEGMIDSQKNIVFLNKNTAIYSSRADQSTYISAVVNKNFLNGAAAAQAIFEFITGDLLSTNFTTPNVEAATNFALNCHNTDIIVDTRKLNGRPKHTITDKLWDGRGMSEMVEGRVNDRWHTALLLDVA
jgi:hypothetical protein